MYGRSRVVLRTQWLKLRTLRFRLQVAQKNILVNAKVFLLCTYLLNAKPWSRNGYRRHYYYYNNDKQNLDRSNGSKWQVTVIHNNSPEVQKFVVTYRCIYVSNLCMLSLYFTVYKATTEQNRREYMYLSPKYYIESHIKVAVPYV